MVLLKLIDKIAFFFNFSQADKMLLVESNSFFVTYEKGDVIIREDATDDALYVLIRGSATVTRNSYPERTLAVLKSGAVFGEISFLTKRPRTTNIVADEKTICFMMCSDTMNELGPTIQIQFRDQLIDVLVKRLDAVNNALPNMLG